MNKKTDHPDLLKRENPFRVPDGYMESLTSRIMESLPEKPAAEVVKISLWGRLAPWLYLAAIIAGLGLFFDFLTGGKDNVQKNASDSLFVQTNVPDGALTALESLESEEDADFLEYLESKYVNYVLAEEIDNYE